MEHYLWPWDIVGKMPVWIKNKYFFFLSNYSLLQHKVTSYSHPVMLNSPCNAKRRVRAREKIWIGWGSSIIGNGCAAGSTRSRSNNITRPVVGTCSEQMQKQTLFCLKSFSYKQPCLHVYCNLRLLGEVITIRSLVLLNESELQIEKKSR